MRRRSRRRGPPATTGAENGHAGPPASGGLTARLEARRSELEAELTAAAGEASLCAISRAAGSVPAAKYLEGRLVALLELRRGLSAGDDGATTCTRLRATWEHGLRDVRSRAAGPDWLAYRAGGVDELTELAAWLDAEDG